MWVSLKKPYKIVGIKEKRYSEHYQIPASRCLIVPQVRREDEILCDVHWKENDGLHALHNIMFDSENLEQVNSVNHSELFELWSSFKSWNDKKDETQEIKRSMISSR